MFCFFFFFFTILNTPQLDMKLGKLCFSLPLNSGQILDTLLLFSHFLLPLAPNLKLWGFFILVHAFLYKVGLNMLGPLSLCALGGAQRGAHFSPASPPPPTPASACLTPWLCIEQQSRLVFSRHKSDATTSLLVTLHQLPITQDKSMVGFLGPLWTGPCLCLTHHLPRALLQPHWNSYLNMPTLSCLENSALPVCWPGMLFPRPHGTDSFLSFSS